MHSNSIVEPEQPTNDISAIWVKEGNWEEDKQQESSDVLHQVAYDHINPSTRLTVGGRLLIAKTKDRQLRITWHGKINKNIEDCCTRLNIAPDFQPPGLPTRCIIQLLCSTYDKETISSFLHAIDSCVSFNKQTKQAIFTMLKLKELVDESGLYAKLKKLVDESLGDGFKDIYDINYEIDLIDIDKKTKADIIWRVAEYCEYLMKPFNLMLACYKNIPKESEHYEEANLRAAMLLIQKKIPLLTASIEKCTNVVEKKNFTHAKLKYVEKALKYMLRAGSKGDLYEAVSLYRKLSGNNDLTPSFVQFNSMQDAKFTEHTLIASAKQIRFLSEENQRLSQEIALLKSKEQPKTNGLSTNSSSLFSQQTPIEKANLKITPETSKENNIKPAG